MLSDQEQPTVVKHNHGDMCTECMHQVCLWGCECEVCEPRQEQPKLTREQVENYLRTGQRLKEALDGTANPTGAMIVLLAQSWLDQRRVLEQIRDLDTPDAEAYFSAVQLLLEDVLP